MGYPRLVEVRITSKGKLWVDIEAQERLTRQELDWCGLSMVDGGDLMPVVSLASPWPLSLLSKLMR